MEGSKKACWSYLKPQAAPALGLVITGPRRSSPLKGEVLIRVDTGYDGFLLIDEESYSNLGMRLAELPRRRWSEGRTVTGESVKLRSAIAKILIPKIGLALQGNAETFRGNKETLIGLKFMESLRVLLDGVKGECCAT